MNWSDEKRSKKLESLPQNVLLRAEYMRCRSLEIRWGKYEILTFTLYTHQLYYYGIAWVFTLIESNEVAKWDNMEDIG